MSAPAASNRADAVPSSWVGSEVEPGGSAVGLAERVSRIGREAARRATLANPGGSWRRPNSAATPPPPQDQGPRTAVDQLASIKAEAEREEAEAEREEAEAERDSTAGRRENVTFVASPTPLLPGLEFEPVRRRWTRRPDILHRVSGRFLLLAFIGLLSLPFLWQGVVAGWLGFGDEVELEPTVIVPEEPAIELVVHEGDVYVDGTVPSVEVRDEVVDRLGAVLGPEVVIDQLVVDPSAVVNLDAPTPLRLDETIRFASGQSAVVGRYGSLISTADDLLSADESVTLLLIGHADSVGRAEENLQLSLERAESVRAALIERGVVAEQISVEARGETEPIASNEDAVGRAVNRRVEFLISGLLG